MPSLLTGIPVTGGRVRGLGSYHTRPVVTRAGDTLRVEDMKLLYYYQNRMAHVEAP